MIDLDQLDAQLNDALSEEVRALRGFAPPAGAPARTLAEVTGLRVPVAAADEAQFTTRPAPANPMDDLRPEDRWDIEPWPITGTDTPAPEAPGDEPTEAPPAEARSAATPPEAPRAEGVPAEAPLRSEPEVVAVTPAPAAPISPRPAAAATARPAKPARPQPARPAPSRPAPARQAPTQPARAAQAASAPAVSARDRLRMAAAAVNGHAAVPGRIDDAGADMVALLAQGRLAEAEKATARRNEPAFHVMQAILQDRERDARGGLPAVRGAGPDQAVWTQRLWIALTFGGEDEQYDVLELCRERAYRYDDVVWRGALTLALARLGRTEEAAREFDATAGRLDVVGADQRPDVVTNLAEAAFLLGDGARATVTGRHLAHIKEPVVVVGRAWVCKGSLARYRALVAATTGRAREADHCFEQAAGTHRAMGATALLARADVERQQLRLALAG